MAASKNILTIYSAEKFYKQNLLEIIKTIGQNIYIGRELIWGLAVRDIKTKYKQSFLGPSWIIIMPFAMMATFLLLNMSGVITLKDIPVPYPIWGFLGFSLWTMFSQGITLTTESVVAASALSSKINTPKEIYVIASFLQTIFDLFVRIIILLLICLAYRRLPSLWILFFPFYITPLCLFTLGIGFFTSILNSIFRDTIHIVSISLGFLIFLTPIMYSFPEMGILAIINSYNPLYFLIEVPRQLFILGKTVYLTQFIFSSLLAVLLFIVGWIVFYRTSSKLTERI